AAARPGASPRSPPGTRWSARPQPGRRRPEASPCGSGTRHLLAGSTPRLTGLQGHPNLGKHFPEGQGSIEPKDTAMTRKVITVALNGVTGRMGYRQHLVRSLLAIREQGGIQLEDGSALYPEPILVGRNSERLRAVAERHGLERWTTSLDEV